ncbi:peptidase associated/transthyretin-like domain-containing protein [Chitinophaga costaii]|uniref:hypothetical protein n=1 Tax=Chitinophaga costaii TaxID=1335309 RepID=UPI000F4E99AC|nr:hypothetical protein [Chitinophaga costaii]
MKTTTLLVTLLFLQLAAAAQQQLVKGTVYERSARFGMVGVSVMSTSGRGTVTDSLGHYSIRLPVTDSISFSYQGKATMKFPVRELAPNHPFDMSLHVDIHVLPTVVVQSQRIHNYRQDSIENREEYAKVFNYQRDYLTAVNGGAGINLDLLFSLKKAKRMERFRERLEADEREKYVDHRFNKDLIRQITGLQPPAIDTFMVIYRPSFEMLQTFENDYDYYKYIQDWGETFGQEWRRRYHKSAYTKSY